MKHLIEWAEALTEGCGRLAGWCSLAILLLTLTVVLLRYVFGIGATAIQETALYLHGTIFTLAAGFTLKRDAHVRVDVFYRRFSARSQCWIDFLGTLLFLFPLALTIFGFSWAYVLGSWRIHESSVEAGGLAYVYLQKSLLLVLSTSLVLEGLAQLYRKGISLKRGEY
ncbi:TRAP transporter small permease subunit [Shewanella cyperi]|uniref:TRAP transporter small permease protein n=1 Tax=Shewanella cyperi TaxID=2814292 RepID=A0A975AKA4_9GAMM|nr:TRAP transporter small permease subunit [Shewanella cyperi]QSX29147.1 TRAP transporter small permease subunit [Shewanella cyperi]